MASEDPRCEMRVLKTILHPDGDRKVEIFQRSDGTFGYEEWKFWFEENSWALVKKNTATVVDTLDRAIYEAQGRVAWMRDLQP